MTTTPRNRLLADLDMAEATIAELRSESWATPLERVGLADALGMNASWILRSAVQDARAAGASWEKIGAMLNITKQAAQQRFTDTAD